MTDIVYTVRVDLGLVHINLFHDKCLHLVDAWA